MELTEFASLLETETKLPVAYHHYDDPPTLPYLIYYVMDREDVRADDTTFVKVNELAVELYSEHKDLSAEQAIESFFDSHEIGYLTQETYLDDEKMYERIYTLEI